ncbi:MAG: hypothetical protein GKR89_27085 [Candidatus Latescibacteria bacterium]|nr:hypothetical protein [Candidatus Latescibacterota bacterium]
MRSGARCDTIGCSLLLVLALVLGAADGSRAQLYRFGKNKVQFTDFDWQKMETPHFDVYFYAEEEELAGYAAHMAEEQYYDLEKKFGHSVQRRIPLVLYSSHIYFSQTNIIPNLLPEGVAGFTEFLKGRVALPLSGSVPEFERVLHHELVHVFMFDRIQTVLQRHNRTQYYPGPLWFSEGLAEYWSGDWDSYGDMILRDALFADRLVSIEQMFYINGTFQMYKEGQSICHYMAERYGEDIFALLLDNWWRGETFAEIFAATTGEPLKTLDDNWIYHLHKKYLPDISDNDPPTKLARALTTEGFNIKPELVPGQEGAEVVFFRNDQGYTHIARMAVEGGVPKLVVEGERSSAFESLHPLSTQPAVSPDGRLVAFSAQHTGRDHLYIWDMEADRQVDKFTFDDIVAITSPSWAPTGAGLVFAGAASSGLTDIYTVDLADGSLRQLTRDLYHDRDPDWSPAGDQIVFSSDRWSGGREGFYNLFLYRLDDDQILTLTRGRHNDVQPDWSADGGQVAFSSDRDAMFNLYTVRLPQEGGREPVQRRTRVLTGAFDPVWLPEDEGLVFSGFEKGRFHIYRLELPAGEMAADSLREASADSLLAEVAVDSLAPADTGWSLEGRKGNSLFASGAYQRKMSLDIAQSQISQDPEFGTSGGIQIGLSDLLGNDQYYFILSHISGSETGFFDGLNMALARLHLGRQLNVAWGLFRLNDRFSSRFGRFVREKRTGGYLELTYPFSMFDRVETRLSLRHADIERQFEGRQLEGWLVSNYLSYTHDSSLWIPTGPLEGTRYSLGAGQTIDFKSSRRFNTTVFGDYRRYFRLSKRSSYAVRLMGRKSFGDVPEFFSLGGSWTLRGYPWRSIWGSKMVLVNNELRFPLLDRLVLGFPFGNIDFRSFRGAVFVDGGNAWNDDFEEWKGSIGAGGRLALGGIFVFRLDASRRTDFKSVGNQTHWDFFFGWDY